MEIVIGSITISIGIYKKSRKLDSYVEYHHGDIYITEAFRSDRKDYKVLKPFFPSHKGEPWEKINAIKALRESYYIEYGFHLRLTVCKNRMDYLYAKYVKE